MQYDAKESLIHFLLVKPNSDYGNEVSNYIVTMINLTSNMAVSTIEVGSMGLIAGTALLDVKFILVTIATQFIIMVPKHS